MILVKHRACPVTLGLLTVGHSSGQLAEAVLEERTVFIVARHIGKHLGQSCQHPAIATGPEILAAITRLCLGIDVFGIAEIEVLLGVEHQ